MLVQRATFSCFLFFLIPCRFKKTSFHQCLNTFRFQDPFIQVDDADLKMNAEVIFELTNDDGYFTINPLTGLIRVANLSLDRETTPTRTVGVSSASLLMYLF